MSDEIYKEIKEYVINNWHKRTGLAVAIILIICVVTPLLWQYDLSKEIGKNISTLEWGILVFIILLYVGIWLWSKEYPRNKAGTIGIVVAIKTENKEDYLKLRSDFVNALKNEVGSRQYNNRNIFNVVNLPEYYSIEANDRPSMVDALEKTGGHFIVCGSCRKRQSGGKENYILDLHAAVRHAPIPVYISDKFSREFTELMPKRVMIPIENEFEGFEVTKDLVGVVSKYIIGIATCLSGDFDLSLELFRELNRMLEKSTSTLPSINKIKGRLNKRISETSLLAAQRAYYKYVKTKDRALLAKVKIHLDTIERIDFDNYAAHMLRAIHYFLTEKDLNKVKHEINRSKNPNDGTWQYSLAFINAYEGDLVKAEDLYLKAFKSSVQEKVPFEVEGFIYDVLEREPKKYQLWYCLGLINRFAKGDKELAKKDFKKFLDEGDEKEFAEQRRKAREYLE